MADPSERPSSTAITIGEIQVLTFRAHVAGPPAIVDALRPLIATPPAWARGAAECTRWFGVQPDEARPDWQQITCDGVPVWSGPRPNDVVGYLLWAVYDAALQYLKGRYLLFHAGAVAAGARGVLLPAASQSGKTTLVAGLLAAGFDYLSDDVAVLDPMTLRLLPFARDLRVRRDSFGALAAGYPELAAGSVPCVELDGEATWYLSPASGAWPTAPVPVQRVVLPRYVPGERTCLTPIARSVALQRLLEQSFNARSRGKSAVERLVELLRGVECFALTVGDLGSAVRLLRE